MNSDKPSTAKNYSYKKKRWLLLAKGMDKIGYAFRRPPESKILQPRKILIVRLDQMGDIIQSFPLLESMRRSFPGVQIHALTTKVGAQLYQMTGLTDENFIWDNPWFDKTRRSGVSWTDVRRWIRKNRYDAVFELRGDIRLIAFLKLCGVQNLVGYGCTGGGFLLDVEIQWEKNRHAIDRSLRFLSAIGGKTILPKWFFPNPSSPFSPSSSVSQRNAVRLAVHPDAGAPSKRWPLSRFAELIDRLLSKGNIEIVLIGADKKMGEALAGQIAGAVENRMGKTSLEQLVQELARCDSLLTNDSGPAHLMAALGKPVFILWSGTADPRIWMPVGNDIYFVKHDVSCSPCELSLCFVDGHPCLTGITVDQVEKDLARFLRISERTPNR